MVIYLTYNLDISVSEKHNKKAKENKEEKNEVNIGRNQRS